MTKINKLVLHGFKSFASRTEIPFSDKFNIILGPNGSGKSNVMDALTFVLGKSSSKAMRAEKTSNLIYNGGKKKEPAKQAEVSIFFDNSNMDFPTEEKEIKITRIVTKTGLSKYKINDKARTRQQIVDLMSIAKINPDAHNIILQGDIVSFCNMKTSERREMIEEIAGISVYEEKKQKALNDLNKVETNVKEAEIVLSERKSYLKELKKDRDQALKFQEMSKMVSVNKGTLLNLQIQKKKDENSKINNQIKELKDSFEKYEQEITKLKNENEEKKKQISDIDKEIEEKGEVEQIKINKEVEILKIEITKNNSSIEHLEQELVKINKREQELSMATEDIKNKTEKINSRKKEFEDNKQKIESEKEKIVEKICDFKKKHNLEVAGDIDKEIEEIDKKSEVIQTEIQTLRENQQENIRKKDNLEYQINTIDEKIKKIQNIENEHKEELNKIKDKRNEFKKSTIQLNEKLDEDSKLSSQLMHSRKELLEQNEKLAELKIKENAVQHSINADIAIKRILELKEKNKGIYNTISELGNANPEYAMALEIAAASRIKSIVVEDDKVAAECINFLRQNKLGTANFLPLNKIKAPKEFEQAKEILKMQGVRGYAVDLIEFDTKFKNAFAYVFSNAIIVDDLNTARKIGIGRAKMVTLDGTYCDVSGAMQGGFRQKNKGIMGFKDDNISKQIKKLESECANISANISTIENKKNKIEEEIISLRNFKSQLEGDIIKAERSLHIGEGELDSSVKDKKELLTEMEKVDKEGREIQMKISNINRDLANMKIKKQQLRDTVNQLRNPRLIAELTTFEEKRNELSQELVKIETELRNINSQIENVFESEIKNINELQNKIKTEKDEADIKIKKLKENNKEQNNILKEKEEVQKKFNAKFKELYSKKTALNNDINANDIKINGKQQKSREIEIKLNTYSLNNTKITVELSSLEQEFEPFKDVELLKETDEEKLKREIYKFEKLKDEIGSVNMKSLEMYDNIAVEYDNLLKKKETLEKERQDVLTLIAEIDKNKKELFMKNFDVINQHFTKIFVELSTKERDAYMELENPEDPFEAGIQIKVKIAGKNSYTDLKSLSGGEKTMTALAFIFAIQEHDPAEFYILDEVDAALDKRNAEKLSELVKRYCAKAQYIIISHNDGVILKADTLFGVSMDQNGVSKITSIKA